MSADYHFTTHWRFDAPKDEIIAILRNALELPRWWPAVYLDVQQLALGDENGLGSAYSLYTKGWLPYTLRWEFTVSDVQQNRFRIDATGDFVGYGVWSFRQDGAATDVTYEWNVSAGKPLLRDLTWLLRPVFEANHHWAMAMGAASLRLELARRAAKTPEERALVPPPPQPTTTSPLPLLLTALGTVALGVFLGWALFGQQKDEDTWNP